MLGSTWWFQLRDKTTHSKENQNISFWFSICHLTLLFKQALPLYYSPQSPWSMLKRHSQTQLPFGCTTHWEKNKKTAAITHSKCCASESSPYRLQRKGARNSKETEDRGCWYHHTSLVQTGTGHGHECLLWSLHAGQAHNRCRVVIFLAHQRNLWLHLSLACYMRVITQSVNSEDPGPPALLCQTPDRYCSTPCALFFFLLASTLDND